jgi:MFS transporter, DHA1 family, tetracycline resistance protein
MDDLLKEVQPQKHNAAIGFIFITLLLDVIGFGIIIPVMPKLIASLKGISIAEASKYGGYLISSFAIAQFFCSPIMGALSDKYGRRPVLLLSLAGFCVDYLLLAFAPTYAWLIVGRILAGVTGASFTTATAYIADISNETNRAKNFGMIGAAFGLGFILGPVIGGLLGQYDAKWPFYASAILCFLNLLYGYFVLPESLSKENRREIDIRKINPVSTVLKLRKYQNIGWLMLAFFFLYFGSHAVQSNWSFYTQYLFKWSETMVGLSLGLVGIMVGIVQGLLVKKSMSKFGENKSVYLGFTLYAIGMFLFAFATQGWMMLLFSLPYCVGGISGPAIQSIMSGRVPANEQGELQGGLTSLQSLTTIFGPLIMTGLFGYVTTAGSAISFVGAPFLLGGILMAISAFISFYALKTSKNA